jgi:hypothetical protein
MFYHGSVQKNLSELRPRNGRLFASPDFRVASVFLAGAQKACCLPVNGSIFAFIEDDREDVLTRDRGGSIYVVKSERFRPVPGGNPAVEWFTTEILSPMISFTYESSIAAIIAFGVQLYFVTIGTVDQIHAASQTGTLIGSDLLKSLLSGPSENKILRALLLKHGATRKIRAEPPSYVCPQI